MENDDLAARGAMMPVTHILKHVPQRIGHSRALDDAVRCIMQGPSTRNNNMALRLYGNALNSLRESLDDELLSRAPETLAAASLLQMYEQYVDTPGGTWSIHACGVVEMLQARGVENLTDDLEKAILETQAGNIFMSALAVTAHEDHLDVFVRMVSSIGTVILD
ncbi:hypothetical protein LTR17_020156 [Elasticomyces elasticus]|nr:hypothetical protein LTR17_020156 [Elasticomyces elasticus]